jgi:gamma-glutamylcyclotransferase (GGCT)/AIG2-like uncharacterized protein YtfP
MRGTYFAYGSNMTAARMASRVPSARALGAAEVQGFRFALDKRGRDGSAKANLVREPGARVWGVVYEIEARAWPDLDACEPGYARIRTSAQLRAGESCEVHVYVSELRIQGARAWQWYKELIVAGAREHDLPEAWTAALSRLPARPGP